MKSISLTFRGETFTVPETRAFDLGAAVEEVVTLAEMQTWGRHPKYFKIARAFGVMLRFAGCKVSDAEVKAEIDASIAAAVDGDDVSVEAVQDIFAVRAIQQLQDVLFDGAPTTGGESAPEKTIAS